MQEIRNGVQCSMIETNYALLGAGMISGVWGGDEWDADEVQTKPVRKSHNVQLGVRYS